MSRALWTYNFGSKTSLLILLTVVLVKSVLIPESLVQPTTQKTAFAGPDRNFPTGVNFSVINSYESIVGWLLSLPNEFPFVRLHHIGMTVEHRDLIVVEIDSTDDGFAVTGIKPTIFVDAGIHAREQLTVSIALNAIHKICCMIRDGKVASSTKVKWFIIPLVNPDGYEYASTDSGVGWRKNRSPANNSDCVGVALNRNWDYKWRSGSSTSPCSDIYAGVRPFSESETFALSQFILELKNNSAVNLQAYLSLHSIHGYLGQAIIFPYGYTTERSPDYDVLSAVAKRMSDAMYAATSRTYRYGSIANEMYPVNGDQGDWLYFVAKIKQNYAVELRDYYGKDSAVLVSDGFKDIWAALTVLAQDTLARNYLAM
ncbi:carboxypeptidase B-like isoform X2 [Paramacrobiotus metropolitanus]|uniref:carboxypeptidase B-like isoform X2 n=1 Tax=Paramacrobiotus metropolitanus TaxID=2943436 RepID=UPI00244568F5|nr:carboxypeptidase B-like isoform X2 [Paramacrobiotus metropolitanus]